MGVISMKLVGEGAFTNREDRKAAMKFAFRNAGVNAVTVGYKNTGGNRRSHREPQSGARIAAPEHD